MNVDITQPNIIPCFDAIKTDDVVKYEDQTCQLSLAALHISEPILQAILFEVCTYPKPGLVTPISTGAHHDMNLHSFIMSSAAIYPCFALCAQLGLQHSHSPNLLLDLIRPIGIEYENRLLAVTHGVNTQRGILFLASILAAAAGHLHAHNKQLSIVAMSETVAVICHNISERDFNALNYRSPKTAGEHFYLSYGIKGIRGEAEAGFPTVINIGLPALLDAFNHGLSLRESFIHCLIAMIAVCEDTAVLSRSNIDVLNQLRQKATEIITLGGMKTHRGQNYVEELDKWCCSQRISPGGAADLLSLTISMYLLCYQCFPSGIC